MPVPMSMSDEPDANARTARLSGHADEAARRLHEGVVSRLVRERADVPVRTDRAVDEPRVASPATRRRRDRGAPPGQAAGSGGRRRRSRRAAARCRGRARRSSETASERFPAFTARNIALSPFQNGGPQARPSSPVSGRSTFTTSAPSAARISAQYGPAIDVVTSITRVPSSGRKAIGGSSRALRG